ncbi:hypothetical protein [Pontimicrobium sp. MEBiC01747]
MHNIKTILLTQILIDSEPHYSLDWLAIHSSFFQKEYLEKLAINLVKCHVEGVLETLSHPHFNEEVTPLLHNTFSRFLPSLKQIQEHDYKSNAITQKAIAKTIETIAFKDILLLMGQRITSATVQTIQGLPLLREEVLASCFKPYNKHISVAVRAWEKHIDRTEDSFWGEIQGKPEEKEEKARVLINTLIDKHTWWNVFYHYKHELVYEIRIATGHGMRWSIKDKTLIGFLEPFL